FGQDCLLRTRKNRSGRRGLRDRLLRLIPKADTLAVFQRPKRIGIVWLWSWHALARNSFKRVLYRVVNLTPPCSVGTQFIAQPPVLDHQDPCQAIFYCPDVLFP